MNRVIILSLFIIVINNLGVIIMSFDPDREDEHREASIEMAEFEELSAMHGQSNDAWSEDDED